MKCPRCGSLVFGENCSRCREEEGQEPGSKTGMLPGSPSAAPAPAADWRIKVREKLDEHYEKKQQAPPPGRTPKRKKPVSGSRTPPLFEYRLDEGPEPEPRTRVVAVASGGPARVVERPLIRTPAGRRRSEAPRQRRLTLEALPPYAPAPAPPAAGGKDSLSPEVLFSRFLAGIIDVMFPVLLGLIFSLTASRILNFEFFSPLTSRFVAAFSLCFYFFNSFFFLILSGQTPGMYFTDLKLTGEGHEEIPLGALSIRILVFPAVAASVLGLLWGVFDPLCRCWHDRLSKTRVVPKE